MFRHFRRPSKRRAHLMLQALEPRDVPAMFTVLNANDSGPGSLRQAIESANFTSPGGDEIAFDPTFFNAANPRTITLLAASRNLRIIQDLVINGPGPAIVTVSGGGAVRPFHVSDGLPGDFNVINVTLRGMTVTGGNGNDGGPTPLLGSGGGIVSGENLTLENMVITGNTSNDRGGGVSAGDAFITVRNSTISGNTASHRGGGLYVFFGQNSGLLMENCTVSGNIATGAGGGGIFFAERPNAGILIRNSTIVGNTTVGSGGGLLGRDLTGTVRIQNSTITGNTASTNSTTDGYGGGGIALNYGAGVPVLTIESSIVSGNTASLDNGRSDIAAKAAATVNVNFSAIGDADGFTPSGTSGNNLPFGAALGLGALAFNGGPTRTIAFDITSPLRNAGTNPAMMTTDQRGPGFLRVVGMAADIGAYEVQPSGSVPQVATVNVNAGQSNTTQRSRVTAIDVVFSTQVTFAGAVASAFTVLRIGGGAIGGFSATANVVGGVTVVTLSGFTGAETRFGSLADGRFQLAVLANQVTAGGLQLDGDGNGTGGDNFVQNGSVANGLFSFYGDANGDGTVNAADFAPFRDAFGSSSGQAGYLAFLDLDGDGFINAFDFAQFRTRFGSSVP